MHGIGTVLTNYVSNMPKRFITHEKSSENLDIIGEKGISFEDGSMEFPQISSVQTPVSRQAVFGNGRHGSSLKPGLFTPKEVKEHSPSSKKKIMFINNQSSHKRLLSPESSMYHIVSPKNTTGVFQRPDFYYPKRIVQNSISQAHKLIGIPQRRNIGSEAVLNNNLLKNENFNSKQGSVRRNARKIERLTFDRIQAHLELPDDSNYNSIVSFVDDLKDTLEVATVRKSEPQKFGESNELNKIAGNSPKNQDSVPHYIKSKSQRFLFPGEDIQPKKIVLHSKLQEQPSEKNKNNANLKIVKKNHTIILMGNNPFCKDAKIKKKCNMEIKYQGDAEMPNRKESSDSLSNREINTAASPGLNEEDKLSIIKQNENNSDGCQGNNDGSPVLNYSLMREELHIQKGEELKLFPNIKIEEAKLIFSADCPLFFDKITIDFN